MQKEFDSSVISYDEKNLITIKFKDGIDLDVDEVKKLVDWSLTAVNGRPFYLLIDARDILSSMTHGARKFFAEHEEYNSLNVAQAIVVNNMPIRLLAMAYYKLYKHSNLIKLFKDIKEAKLWLLKN